MGGAGRRRRSWAGLGLLLIAAPLLQGNLGLRSNLEARLLAQHNRERSSIGVGPLHWDAALAQDATRWAAELAERGVMEHYDGADADLQGENLAMGTAHAFTPEKLAELWVQEKVHFVRGTFPQSSRTGNWADVAHYTQLVWGETGAVGCALATGAEADFLVCRYATAGNVEGERPF
jgi:hypothetical protein